MVLRDSATAELLLVVVGPMRSNSSKTALWLYVAQWAASCIVLRCGDTPCITTHTLWLLYVAIVYVASPPSGRSVIDIITVATGRLLEHLLRD